MWLRANVVLAIAVVFALVQMFASATGGPRTGAPNPIVSAIIGGQTHSAVAQDDNDEDNGDDDSDNDDDDDDADNGDDGDNSDDDVDNDDDDADNSDDDSDNDDADNDDDDSDNDDDDDVDNEDDVDDDDADNEDDADDSDVVLDNVEASDTSAPAATTTPTTTTVPSPGQQRPAAVASPSPSPQPVTEVSTVTTGADQLLSMNEDRITLQLFSTLPPGMTVTVRMVDPLAYPATAGIRAGDLIFQIEVKDATGAIVTTLPGEVNLGVRYNDADVVGLNESNITLARLDPTDNQWKVAPKLMTDPASNFIAATITDTGVYAVFVLS